MKIQEMRQLTTKKLWEQLRKTRRELAVVRFHVKTGQNQNTAKIKYLRKTIARILTLLHNEKRSS